MHRDNIVVASAGFTFSTRRSSPPPPAIARELAVPPFINRHCPGCLSCCYSSCTCPSSMSKQPSSVSKPIRQLPHVSKPTSSMSKPIRQLPDESKPTSSMCKPEESDYLGPSCMTQTELSLYAGSFQGESSLPGNHTRPDQKMISAGWMVAFKSWFDAGLVFPLHPLLISLMKTYGVQLHHLSPEVILRANIFRWFYESTLQTPPSEIIFHNIFILQKKISSQGSFGCFTLNVRKHRLNNYPVITFPNKHQMPLVSSEHPSKWFYLRLFPANNSPYAQYTPGDPTLKKVAQPSLLKDDESRVAQLTLVRHARSCRDLLEEMVMAQALPMKPRSEEQVVADSLAIQTAPILSIDEARKRAEQLLGPYNATEQTHYQGTVIEDRTHNIVAAARGIVVPSREVIGPPASYLKRKSLSSATDTLGGKKAKNSTDLQLGLLVGSREEKRESITLADPVLPPKTAKPAAKVIAKQPEKTHPSPKNPTSLADPVLPPKTAKPAAKVIAKQQEKTHSSPKNPTSLANKSPKQVQGCASGQKDSTSKSKYGSSSTSTSFKSKRKSTTSSSSSSSKSSSTSSSSSSTSDDEEIDVVGPVINHFLSLVCQPPGVKGNETGNETEEIGASVEDEERFNQEAVVEQQHVLNFDEAKGTDETTNPERVIGEVHQHLDKVIQLLQKEARFEELDKSRQELCEQVSEIRLLKRELQECESLISLADKRAIEAQNDLKEGNPQLHIQVMQLHQVLKGLQPSICSPTLGTSIADSLNQLSSQVDHLGGALPSYTLAAAVELIKAGVSFVELNSKGPQKDKYKNKPWKLFKHQPGQAVNNFMNTEGFEEAAKGFVLQLAPELTPDHP